MRAYCSSYGNQAGDPRCICLDNVAMLTEVMGPLPPAVQKDLAHLAICLHDTCSKRRVGNGTHASQTMFEAYLKMTECPSQYTVCIPTLDTNSITASAVTLVNNCGSGAAAVVPDHAPDVGNHLHQCGQCRGGDWSPYAADRQDQPSSTIETAGYSVWTHVLYVLYDSRKTLSCLVEISIILLSMMYTFGPPYFEMAPPSLHTKHSQRSFSSIRRITQRFPALRRSYQTAYCRHASRKQLMDVKCRQERLQEMAARWFLHKGMDSRLH